MSEPNKFHIIDHYRNLTRHLLARNAIVDTIFSHRTLLGNPAEGILRDFLRKLLPSWLRVETGQVVAINGIRSPQSDVIIFDDNFGAIVGASEADEFLIRQEAVRCVIEVKRTIGGTIVQEMQGYASSLATSFFLGEKSGGWLQFGFAFIADRSRDAVLENLKKTYDPGKSLGALLVLDTAPQAEELKASARKHLNLTEPDQSGRATRPTITGQSVKAFTQEVTEPRGALFLRHKTEKYCIVNDGLPPLLSFTMLLEQRLKGATDRSNLNLGDFLPAIEADECVAKIRAASGTVEIDDTQTIKPIVKITVTAGTEIDGVAQSLRLFGKLKTLVLAGTLVRDEDITHIANLKELQTLSLASTSITDAGLKHLTGLKALQEIDLTGAKVTDAGVGELKKSIPNLQVRK